MLDVEKKLKLEFKQRYPNVELSTIVSGKGDLIILTFPQSRIATVEEFKFLRIFCLDNHLEINEDVDFKKNNPGQQIYIYIITLDQN